MAATATLVHTLKSMHVSSETSNREQRTPMITASTSTASYLIVIRRLNVSSAELDASMECITTRKCKNVFKKNLKRFKNVENLKLIKNVCKRWMKNATYNLCL